MDQNLILEKVKTQAGQIFTMDPDDIQTEDSHKTIKGWDSLAHLRLFMALEAEFAMKFDVGEMTGSRSIKDIVNLINRRQ